MYFASRSGDGWLYFVIAIIICFYDYNTTLFFSLSTLIAFAIELPIQHSLKYIFKRSRPFIKNQEICFLLRPPDEYSFPSGHTAGATIFCMMIVMYFGIDYYYVFSWAILVGISRVYNCVHYVSDVIAGFILGIFSSLIAITILF